MSAPNVLVRLKYYKAEDASLSTDNPYNAKKVKNRTFYSSNQSNGEDYMKYRRVATHFVGMKGTEDMDGVGQEAIDSLNTGVFTDFKADNGAPLLVGEMVSRHQDGSVALMVCAADDHHEEDPKSYNLTFRCDNRCIRALGGEGYLPVTKLENGYYSVPINSNQGVLITAR